MDVNDALSFEEWDHHELLSKPTLPGLLVSWGARMFSLGLWIITVGPALITGYQRLKGTWI